MRTRSKILLKSLALPSLTGFAFLQTSAVWAEESDAHKAGMPQLDPLWFPSQFFWLAISFGALYFLMSRLVLPRVAHVQVSRRQQIQEDVHEAHKMRDQLAAMLTAYDSEKAIAKAKAQLLLSEADKETSALAVKSNKELDAILNDHITQADRRLNNLRGQVLSSMPQITGDVAVSILKQIANLDIDFASAEAVARQIVAAKKGS